MGNSYPTKILLRDLSKDISSLLNQGTKKILILPSNNGQAEEIVEDVMSRGNLWFKMRIYIGRRVRICDENNFFSYKDKHISKNGKAQRYNTQINYSPTIPKIYRINLRNIELI